MIARDDDGPEPGGIQLNWRRWSTGQTGSGVPKARADCTETMPSFGPSSWWSMSKNGRIGQQTSAGAGSPATQNVRTPGGTNDRPFTARAARRVTSRNPRCSIRIARKTR